MAIRKKCKTIRTIVYEARLKEKELLLRHDDGGAEQLHGGRGDFNFLFLIFTRLLGSSAVKQLSTPVIRDRKRRHDISSSGGRDTTPSKEL